MPPPTALSAASTFPPTQFFASATPPPMPASAPANPNPPGSSALPPTLPRELILYVEGGSHVRSEKVENQPPGDCDANRCLRKMPGDRIDQISKEPCRNHRDG
jgi:hypothetical protein